MLRRRSRRPPAARKAKRTAAPIKAPSKDTLQAWFSLPLPSPRRVKASGTGSIPIVLAERGKSVLAQIGWPNDGFHQARFAGGGDPYSLSPKEYLELANSDGFRMLDLITDDLLAAWSIRAARRKPEFANQPESLLRWIFTSQLVCFLVGPDKNVIWRSAEQIARRYLLAENWKFTMASQFGRIGTTRWFQGRELDRARLRDFMSKYPLLSDSELIGLAEQEPELYFRGKAPTLYRLRRARAESKAKP